MSSRDPRDRITREEPDPGVERRMEARERELQQREAELREQAVERAREEGIDAREEDIRVEREGGRVRAELREEAVEREVREEVAAQSPDVEPEDVEVSVEDGEVVGRVEQEAREQEARGFEPAEQRFEDLVTGGEEVSEDSPVAARAFEATVETAEELGIGEAAQTVQEESVEQVEEAGVTLPSEAERTLVREAAEVESPRETGVGRAVETTEVPFTDTTVEELPRAARQRFEGEGFVGSAVEAAAVEAASIPAFAVESVETGQAVLSPDTERRQAAQAEVGRELLPQRLAERGVEAGETVAERPREAAGFLAGTAAVGAVTGTAVESGVRRGAIAPGVSSAARRTTQRAVSPVTRRVRDVDVEIDGVGRLRPITQQRETVATLARQPEAGVGRRFRELERGEPTTPSSEAVQPDEAARPGEVDPFGERVPIRTQATFEAFDEGGRRSLPSQRELQSRQPEAIETRFAGRAQRETTEVGEAVQSELDPASLQLARQDIRQPEPTPIEAARVTGERQLPEASQRAIRTGETRAFVEEETPAASVSAEDIEPEFPSTPEGEVSQFQVSRLELAEETGVGDEFILEPAGGQTGLPAAEFGVEQPGLLGRTLGREPTVTRRTTTELDEPLGEAADILEERIGQEFTEEFQAAEPEPVGITRTERGQRAQVTLGGGAQRSRGPDPVDIAEEVTSDIEPTFVDVATEGRPSRGALPPEPPQRARGFVGAAAFTGGAAAGVSQVTESVLEEPPTEFTGGLESTRDVTEPRFTSLEETAAALDANTGERFGASAAQDVGVSTAISQQQRQQQETLTRSLAAPSAAPTPPQSRRAPPVDFDFGGPEPPSDDDEPGFGVEAEQLEFDVPTVGETLF